MSNQHRARAAATAATGAKAAGKARAIARSRAFLLQSDESDPICCVLAPGTWQSSVALGGSATVATYAGVAEPRTLGAGGGHGCYYQSCSSSYGAGGQGGGRIYLSSAERMTLDGATISANGAGGSFYSFNVGYGAYYPAGGGGSGGSVLIKAPSMQGGAMISADGGAPAGSSTRLSGGGAGGRIGIHASSSEVPSTLTLSAAGGTASGSACAGSAGTIFLNSSAPRQTSLLIDNANANVASSTYTPLPVDGGIDLTDVSIVRNSNVKISDETVGFRARRLWIDSSSEMSGSILKATRRRATRRSRAV